MINVCKASRQDSEAVSKLLKERYNFISLKEANRTFKTECRNQHFRVAKDDGCVVGLISWRPQGTINHGVAELTRITVSLDAADPVLIKEMLFDVMIAEADFFYKQHSSKLRKVFSMIHADNRQVKEFFIDKGMQQEAILRNHFYRGTDELIFSMFFS